ncbi:hypothetical protein [uncultured Rothia sp.]|uniref:hypothetical protein n=1 Tax=uncultured Rothia sp. TaxID=316088 RepID=UPI0025F9AA98|nr:hypothetical protein [uncultured Rothia sp.]
MASSLFTATVEFRRPGAQQWEILAQATDTLAGLVEWAAPAQEALQRPVPPLSAETVRGFISAAFGHAGARQRVRVEPAAEDAKSTLDVLEDFARRREGGAVTVEDAERHAVMSERYFRPPNGFFFA